VQLVKETLESMTELGGWASDAQVDDYRVHVKIKAAMMEHSWALENQSGV
jgi:hypothetical protein